jgi:hypothetical protein
MNFRAQKLHQAVIATLLLTGSVGVLAQSKTIELQTDAGLLPIPLDDNSGLDIGADGTIFTKAAPGFVCDQGASCDDVAVSVANADGGALSISPSTVTQGNNFTVQWASRGAWECAGTGLDSTTWNSNNPKPPSGSESVNTDNLTVGNHLIELVCENGPVSDSRTVSLSVEEPSTDTGGTEGLPEVCNTVTMLDQYNDWSKATDILYPWGENETQTFPNIFNSWPGTGNSTLLGMRHKQFVALSFTTGTLDSTSKGQISVELPSGSGSSIVGTNAFIASISQCPGDIDPNSAALPEAGCLKHIATLMDTYKWGGPGAGAHCTLASNTKYYLNLVYTDSPVGQLPPGSATCGGESRCGHKYRASGAE